MIRPFLAAPLLLGVLLAGCATPSYHSPVEVTRFTAPASEVPRGPIGVRPAPGEDAEDPAYAAYQTAVTEALTAAGFQVVGGVAPFIAQVDVQRATLEAGRGRGPVSVGGGASTGSYGSGLGLGVGIDLTPAPPDEIETLLSVSIRPSGGGDAVWEGRARFSASANNEYADLRTSAGKVAAALFQGFPGNSGETIEIE
jgi:hypothetical protein